MSVFFLNSLYVLNYTYYIIKIVDYFTSKGCLSLFDYFIDMSPTHESFFLSKKHGFEGKRQGFSTKKLTHMGGAHIYKTIKWGKTTFSICHCAWAKISVDINSNHSISHCSYLNISISPKFSEKSDDFVVLTLAQ